MEQARWKFSRAGFFNFWYYDYQEYYFKDGRLLLRGGNGSGKSVTMQSLVTFLLDGNKHPARLDPFGSKDRTMREYLLGEKHVNHIENRIGYLFLEYQLGDSEQYITTGYGLEAKKDTNKLEDWGFVIFNRFTRIHKGINGIPLYKTEMINGTEVKIPLNRSEFKKAVGTNGIVCDSKEEYASSVNKYLFGFSDYKKLEQFTEVLKELKSPKLSKSFKPTDLSEILLNSLPGLTAEELTPLTETISAIDQIENDIKKAEEDIKALGKISSVYNTYNQLVLLEKAVHFLDSKKKLTSEIKSKKENEKELEQLCNEKTEIENQIMKLVAELEVLENEKRSLGLGEIETLKMDQNKIIHTIKDLNKKIESKNSMYDSKQMSINTKDKKIDEAEAVMEVLKREISDFLIDLENTALEMHFEQHEELASHFKRNFMDGSYSEVTSWKEDISNYKSFVQKIRQSLIELEKMTQSRDKLIVDITNMSATIDEEQKQQRLLESNYENERAVLFENVEEWIKQNREFEVDETLKQSLGQTIQGLLERVNEDALRAPIEEQFAKRKSDIIENEVKADLIVTNTKKQISKITEEIKHIENQKDIEPYWGEKEEVLLSLREKGIPHIPFYAAVEFKEGIEETVKNSLEAAFEESGLLKALIVPEAHRKTVANKITVAEKTSVKAHNLLTYLFATPENGISKEEIDAILSSISVEEHEEGYILENGYFNQGFISGVNQYYGEAKYVGKMARKQLKEQKLKELENQLVILKNELLQQEEFVQNLRNKLKDLEQEYKNFPSISAMKKAKELYENKKREIENIYQFKLNHLNDEVKELSSNIIHYMSNIKAKMDFSELDLTIESFDNAFAAANDYWITLNSLEAKYDSYKNKISAIEDLKYQKEELEVDMDDIREDLSSLESSLARQKSRQTSIEKQLEAHNAKEIEKRYETIITRLKEIPSEIDLQKDEKRDIEGDIKEISHKIQQAANTIVFMNHKTDVWKDVFLREYKSGLCELEVEDAGESIEALAKEVRNKLKPLHQVNNQDDILKIKANALKRLEKSFNDQLAYLAEYNLTKLIEIDDFTLEAKNEADEQEIRYMKTICQRQKVELELDFTMRSPNVVMKKWEEHLIHQESVLTKKERKLFEETIIETIGTTIKNRIQHSTYWVKEMNIFMENQSNSNGLGFKINWTEKEKAEKTEDSSRRVSIMDLLKKDVTILSDNDREKISKFFKKKVTEAKRNAEKDSQVTLFSAIKEALDYRRWYQFDIMYKKGDTGYKFVPLTNKRFNQFSGGEKALSMYVPLLSAVHSRLREASPEAPRIIALDEAFAGVDDKNINEMFQLVENLDFDYIMNSQALWGCYEKVSSLSIYEIIRPQDAPFVGTAQYEWDGTNKNYIVQGFSFGEEQTMENVQEKVRA